MRSPLRALGGLAARSPLPWTYPGRQRGTFMNLFAGDRLAQQSAMTTDGTLFTIVNGIAADTAAVEWHMHRFAGAGGRRLPASVVCELCDERGVEYVEDHQALRVWNNPNDFTTGQEFRESIQQHIDLTGEGWMVAEMSDIGDFPLSLWGPRPDRMEVIPDRDEFLSGYLYRAPTGEEVPLATDEVVQVRMPNPLDPYRGLGPVQAMMVELDATRYTAAWNRQFFQNSAIPGGVIEVPKELPDTVFRRIRDQWQERHRGMRNAHRVAILESGATWKDTAFSQRDMQFTELYSLGKKGIREAYRYPEFMLGTMENANKASATATETYYARRILVPRLNRLKTSANADFLPMFGATARGVRLVFTNPVPADAEDENAERTSKVDAYVALTGAGVDPFDAAQVVGLPPMRHATRTAEPVGAPA